MNIVDLQATIETLNITQKITFELPVWKMP